MGYFLYLEREENTLCPDADGKENIFFKCKVSMNCLM